MAKLLWNKTIHCASSLTSYSWCELSDSDTWGRYRYQDEKKWLSGKEVLKDKMKINFTAWQSETLSLFRSLPSFLLSFCLCACRASAPPASALPCWWRCSARRPTTLCSTRCLPWATPAPSPGTRWTSATARDGGSSRHPPPQPRPQPTLHPSRLPPIAFHLPTHHPKCSPSTQTSTSSSWNSAPSVCWNMVLV